MGQRVHWLRSFQCAVQGRDNRTTGGPAEAGANSVSQGATAVTYVIAQPCVDLKDLACVEECPVDCIYEGKRMLYIHPDECVDCGACEPVCPVEAIFYEDDVPAQWKEFTAANAAFFTEGAERPTSAPWCATSPSSPTTRCLTASSPAHEHGRTVVLGDERHDPLDQFGD